jgi:hypothetical protein
MTPKVLTEPRTRHPDELDDTRVKTQPRTVRVVRPVIHSQMDVGGDVPNGGAA